MSCPLPPYPPTDAQPNPDHPFPRPTVDPWAAIDAITMGDGSRWRSRRPEYEPRQPPDRADLDLFTIFTRGA